MRASTLGCRFLDRCGCRLGVEISFKDICILAAVLNSTCRSKFGPYVRASSDKVVITVKACFYITTFIITTSTDHNHYPASFTAV